MLPKKQGVKLTPIVCSGQLLVGGCLHFQLWLVAAGSQPTSMRESHCPGLVGQLQVKDTLDFHGGDCILLCQGRSAHHLLPHSTAACGWSCTAQQFLKAYLCC